MSLFAWKVEVGSCNMASDMANTDEQELFDKLLEESNLPEEVRIRELERLLQIVPGSPRLHGLGGFALPDVLKLPFAVGKPTVSLDHMLHELQPGDLVFKGTSSMVHWLSRKLYKETAFTHVLIVCSVFTDTYGAKDCVLYESSVSPGVHKIESLREYYKAEVIGQCVFAFRHLTGWPYPFVFPQSELDRIGQCYMLRFAELPRFNLCTVRVCGALCGNGLSVPAPSSWWPYRLAHELTHFQHEASGQQVQLGPLTYVQDETLAQPAS